MTRATLFVIQGCLKTSPSVENCPSYYLDKFTGDFADVKSDGQDS